MRNIAGDNLDVIVEPRYDTQTILAAGALTLTYFTIPLGQGQSNFALAGVAKQLADTNMDLSAQLPAGYNFVILGFRVQPSFTMTVVDSRNWCVGGVFTFNIGSKPFLRVPLDTIPAGIGPAGFATVAVGGAPLEQHAASHGAPLLANGFSIARKPLELFQTQNFNATLSWVALSPVGGVVPTQAAPGLPVRVYLDGYLKRYVQ
jgi:hypothetical protein